MQNHKVVGRVCLFMFVVGCGASLSGVDEHKDKLHLLKKLANSKKNKTVTCRVGSVGYVFKYAEPEVIKYYMSIGSPPLKYTPEIFTIILELFNEENNIIKEEIIEKIIDREGKTEYSYEKRSDFEDVPFISCDDQKIVTMIRLHSEEETSIDLNYVKPIFEKAVLFFTDLLLL